MSGCARRDARPRDRTEARRADAEAGATERRGEYGRKNMCNTCLIFVLKTKISQPLDPLLKWRRGAAPPTGAQAAADARVCSLRAARLVATRVRVRRVSFLRPSQP